MKKLVNKISHIEVIEDYSNCIVITRWPKKKIIGKITKQVKDESVLNITAKDKCELNLSSLDMERLRDEHRDYLKAKGLYQDKKVAKK